MQTSRRWILGFCITGLLFSISPKAVAACIFSNCNGNACPGANTIPPGQSCCVNQPGNTCISCPAACSNTACVTVADGTGGLNDTCCYGTISFGQACGPNLGSCCLGNCGADGYCCGDQGQHGNHLCTCKADGVTNGGNASNCCSGYSFNGTCYTPPGGYCIAAADCGPAGSASCTPATASCCLNNGSHQPCAYAADCCSRECDTTTSRCVACIPIGDATCGSTADCCTGFCDPVDHKCEAKCDSNPECPLPVTQNCKVSTGKCCTVQGSQCAHAGDCCSGNCYYNSFGNNYLCGCANSQGSCQDDDWCCYGLICTGTTNKTCTTGFREFNQACTLASGCDPNPPNPPYPYGQNGVMCCGGENGAPTCKINQGHGPCTGNADCCAPQTCQNVAGHWVCQ
jgi:hypothetical protein